MVHPESDPARRIIELEAAVARLQDDVIANQRVMLLGKMSAMVMHEINNLLAPVLPRAQDALARDDVAAMRKALDRTVIGSQKVIAISRHLLDLPGKPEMPIERCCVAQAVR